MEEQIIAKYKAQCEDALEQLLADRYGELLPYEDAIDFADEVNNCKAFYKQKALDEIEKLNNEEE